VKITPTHRRITLLVLVAGAAFCGGGLTVLAFAEPEVITISEDVPPSCGDAARQANAALKAWDNLDQYETKAEVMAADLTLVTLAGDASLIEDALAPIAKHNEKENEWRLKRDSAQAAFETAADECLAKAAAAEAANGR
jgi:hypothetical protein